MTESDWLSSRNATALLDYLFPQQNSSPVPVRVARKVRLYWCGLCRAGWYRLPPAGRAAVDYAERLADGLAYDPAVGHTVLNAVRDLMLAFDRPETVARIERDLGITSGLLLKWRDRYQVKAGPGDAELAPSDLAAAQAEIRRLKRQLVIAEQERDILKKAVSIFSKLEP